MYAGLERRLQKWSAAVELQTAAAHTRCELLVLHCSHASRHAQSDKPAAIVSRLQVSNTERCMQLRGTTSCK